MTGLLVASALIVNAAAADGFLGVELIAHEESGKPVVKAVLKGSPADKSGIEAGDVIEKLDGEAVLSVQDLIDKVKATKPDTEIKVTVRRGKDAKEIKVKVGTKPDMIGG